MQAKPRQQPFATGGSLIHLHHGTPKHRSKRSEFMKGIAGIGLIALMALTSSALAAAPGQKTPPSCAAIAFRTVASGMTDGDQDAGLYKSRFGRIVLKATVKSGEAQDYHVEVDGKAPTALATPPAGLASCAQAKQLPAPGAASGACTGDGFKVIVDHAGKDRLVALYARTGKTWRFCRAGSA
jgi:hypothetical protein